MTNLVVLCSFDELDSFEDFLASPNKISTGRELRRITHVWLQGIFVFGPMVVVRRDQVDRVMVDMDHQKKVCFYSGTYAVGPKGSTVANW